VRHFWKRRFDRDLENARDELTAYPVGEPGCEFHDAESLTFAEIAKPLKRAEPFVKLQGTDMPVIVHGKEQPSLKPKQYSVISALINAGSGGLAGSQLKKYSKTSHAGGDIWKASWKSDLPCLKL
jgi:hypothetical protein